MIYVPELPAYIVIGGIIDFDNTKTRLATISQFYDGVWKQAGQLNAARSVSFLFLFVLRITGFIIKGLQAQWANGALIVAGGIVDGETQASSETCTLNEKGEFTCNNISPLLPKALLGVSFLVPSNYCK